MYFNFNILTINALPIVGKMMLVLVRTCGSHKVDHNNYYHGINIVLE